MELRHAPLPIVRYPSGACELLSITPVALRRLIDRGDLPPPTYVHKKFQFWRWEDFVRAIDELDRKYKPH